MKNARAALLSLSGANVLLSLSQVRGAAWARAWPLGLRSGVARALVPALRTRGRRRGGKEGRLPRAPSSCQGLMLWRDVAACAAAAVCAAARQAAGWGGHHEEGHEAVHQGALFLADSGLTVGACHRGPARREAGAGSGLASSMQMQRPHRWVRAGGPARRGCAGYSRMQMPQQEGSPAEERETQRPAGRACRAKRRSASSGAK